VLQWARSQQPPCPWDEEACSEAARGGHLEVLQWARSQEPPCPWDTRTRDRAASGRHQHVLEWLGSKLRLPKAPRARKRY
jgi:hypothetical protein